MPILPETLSRKFFNATVKVKQFIDSIDAGVNDYNISNSPIGVSISQSSYVCTQTIEKSEKSLITEVQNNTICREHFLFTPELFFI